MPTSHIALLRGINVGGKNKLPMRDLVAIFQDAGCANVRTYIQSGNVLFEASARVLGRLQSAAKGTIKRSFGYDVPVVIRSSTQIEEIIRRNPFVKRGEDESFLHVMFLADTPKLAQVRQLDPHRAQPDEFIVRGPDIYLYLPHGAARTKLTNAYFDSTLKTVSTGRNWRTINKLAALAKS